MEDRPLGTIDDLEMRVRRHLTAELTGFDYEPPPFVGRSGSVFRMQYVAAVSLGIVVASLTLMVWPFSPQQAPSGTSNGSPRQEASANATPTLAAESAIPTPESLPSIDIVANWSRPMRAHGGNDHGIPWRSTHWGIIHELERVTVSFGWAQTDEGLRVTRDGGSTWSDATPIDASEVTPQWRVWFASEELGLAFGDDSGSRLRLWRTLDGGTTWASSRAFSKFPSAEDAAPALDVGPDGAATIVIFDRGKLRRFVSRDLGDRWSEESAVPVGFIPGSPWVATAGHTSVFVAPDTSNVGRGVIVTTSQDGGATWEAATMAEVPDCETPEVWPIRLTMLTQSRGLLGIWCRSGLVVFDTDNGGRDWDVMASLDAEPSAMVFLSDVAWIVVSAPLPEGFFTYTTHNSGETWTHDQVNVIANDLHAGGFVDGLHAWVVINRDAATPNGRRDDV